jgi:D-alanyl-D-alanine carboxypeptidase
MKRRAALALLLLAAAPAGAQSGAAIEASVRDTGFAGRVLVARGDSIVYRGAFGEPFGQTDPDRMGRYAEDMVWPWASVTKQVLAVLAMQQVEAGKLALDAPASRYLPELARGTVPVPTVRQLLQHRSGLRNPDESAPDTLTLSWKGEPGFYSIGPTGTRWCLGQRKAPGGAWRYNNCDYIVLGTLLERVTGKPLGRQFAERIATPLKLAMTGFARDRYAPARLSDGFHGGPNYQEWNILARFAGAGGLAGTEADLLAFDRALMTGRLLSPQARDTLWRADPALGYMALGQWVFDAPLKGCAKPVRIVERRGEIGRFQVRNLILPERDMAVIAFTNRKAFDFGEIWQGKGLSYDLLSAAVCA